MQILTEEGPPFLVIRRAIEHLGANLLVVGTHGRTGVSRVLLGSVAERVISSEVECDVLVVPAGGVAS
jgi:nucleotide-binding universal stress UspA family protein